MLVPYTLNRENSAALAKYGVVKVVVGGVRLFFGLL